MAARTGTFLPMITLLDDLPDSVLGIAVDGDLDADDYTETIEPALLAAPRDADGKLRVLCEVGPRFPHLSLGAMAQDIREGFTYLRQMARIAVVTDNDALARMAPIGSALVPGEVRAWPSGERAAAVAWLDAD